MKTPVVRKPNSNVIVDPYKELDKSNTKLLQIMKFPPETEADKNWMMYGDGSFHSGGSRHIFIYLLPASVAAFYIEIDKKESNFINQGLTAEQKLADEQRPALAYFDKGLFKNGVCQTQNSEYLCLDYGKRLISEREHLEEWIEVPRLFFSGINDYVYLVVSCVKEPKIHAFFFPENQPFFWDKPVATSIFDNQTVEKSKILLGRVKSIAKIDNVRSLYGSRPKYAEKTYKVNYAWEESSADDKFCFKDDDSVCTIIKKSAVCSIQGENYASSLMLPVYVYRRDRISNDISAFVWHSGNEDDMVKKSLLGCKEGDEEFYNKYRFLRESLSLETIYGSFASLTKLSELNAAKYIVRSLAHQPEGNRCISIEGHLQHLIGGALYRIQGIIEQSRNKGQKILTDEDYNRVNRLFLINGSHLFYDSSIDFTGINENDEDRVFLEKVLGLKEGSNGCQRLSTLLRKVFSHVLQMGIRVDYINCDIENINNDARSLAVHRFNTRYQYKDESNNAEQELKHKIYGVLQEDINNYESSEIKEALKSLGYYENGNGYVNIASVPADDDTPGLYGISNDKSYAQRRNVNVWDVVMKNYTNKLFYKYIFNPILNSLNRPLKGLPQMPKCSADSRYHSKGYLNRAERYETYLGGTLELSGGMYSSIPLYGDHMTRGYVKPNMDNWKILSKPTPFSFFMDNINRLRLVALSSPPNRFNVFISSWNIWVYELNKELHFLKNNNINGGNKEEKTKNQKLYETAQKYHKELLYHAFLLNPDKAIAYFSMEPKRRDEDDYIAFDERLYFTESYNYLQGILQELNKRLTGGEIIPQTKTLAVETEPYVLSCAEVSNKWIWRLTVNEEINPIIEKSTVSFITGGRSLIFNAVENCVSNHGIGFWIETLKDVKPQVFSNTENFYTDHPAINNIGDFSLNPIDGKLTLVDSYKDKNNENKETPSDYLCLSFPYNQYTVLGEIPKYHSISMKFKIDRDMNKTCYLLQLSALQNEQGKLICFALNPNSIQCTDTVPFSLLNVKNANKPSFDITKGETYTLVVSFKITAIVENEFSGDVYYKLTDETEQKIWTSGILNWNFYNSMGNQCLADDIKLWNHKQRPGCLMADNKPVLLSSLLKKYLEGIDEDKQETERINWLTDMYKKVLDSAPVAIEDFSLCISGHQEKVELFREDNGLNITRVNKEVIAYAESELYEAFSDAMIAKFSWLNAEAKSIRYNLSFSEKVDKDNTDCPHGNCIKLSQASDKSIEIEVMPQSEGYILIRFPEGTRKISDIFYNLKEI